MKLDFTINEINDILPKKEYPALEYYNNERWGKAVIEALNGNQRIINELLKIQDYAPPSILEIIGEMGIFNKIINKVNDFNNIHADRGFYWLLAGENFELMQIFIDHGFNNLMLIKCARDIAIRNHNIEFIRFLEKRGFYNFDY